MGFGKEDHRGEMPFSPHYIKGAYYQYTLITVDVNLDHLADIVFATFLRCKLLFFFLLSFHTVLFGSNSLGVAYTQRMKSYVLPP